MSKSCQKHLSESWHCCAVIRHLFRELRQLLWSKQWAANILKLPNRGKKKKIESFMERKCKVFLAFKPVFLLGE